MALTDRRKEFLAEVIRLAGMTGDPVHHREVSELLGVSVGTSYDMLRALEQAGYLEREYRLRGGGQGRSQVVYRPTAGAVSLFSAGRDAGAPSELLWQTTVAEIERLFAESPGEGFFDVLSSFAGELRGEIPPLVVCARVVGLLLLETRSDPHNGCATIRSLLSEAPSSVSRVTLFVAYAVGGVETRLGGLVDFGESPAQLLRAVRALSPGDAERLAAFLDRALEELKESR